MRRAVVGTLLIVFASAQALAGCASRTYVIGSFDDHTCDEHAGALACSGFEDPELADWSDIYLESDARVEQTEVRAYAGQGALHARSTGAQSSAVVVQEFPAVSAGELFLRAQLYVPSGLPTRTLNLFFLGDSAAPDPFTGVDFNLEDGAPSIYSPQATPDRVTSTTTTIPRDAWFCLLLRMVVSDDAGAVRVFVDDQLALEQDAIDTRPDGGVHELRAGIDWSSLQREPFEVYMDDVVLDREPLSCARP